MRAALWGLGLMIGVAAAGCYQAVQQRAQAHEDHLKRTLGVAGQVGQDSVQARAKPASAGHAPAAH
jgi:hypothetical protein